MTPPSVCSTSEDDASLQLASTTGRKPQKFATLCATVEAPDASHKDQYGSSSVPIYQTATFKGMDGQYDYSRSGNPTRSHLQHHIAKISSAQHAFALTSGMAALDVIFRLLKPGDEIIAGNDLYGGSNRLLTYLREHNGIITHHIPTTDPSAVIPFLTRPDSNVTMVLLETPTNPLLQIADIAAIAALVHQYRPDALVVVDNTMMSPYLQRPLEHGADLVYDSGTKYLSGHHDLMAGLVTCNRDDIAKKIAFIINSIGNALPAFDSFLLLRGVKTLALRLDRQQATTHLVAHYLNNLGFRVNYPGLPNHPGKEIHDRLASGAGAVLSFETGDKGLSEEIVSKAKLWGVSVSFGCVNSLISMPCLMSHASIAPALRAARNLPEDLIRLCIGIEDAGDLIDDLETALIQAGAVRVMDEAVAGGRRRVERVYASDDARVQESSIAKNGSCIVVSAPGKVILFGEHAVVHGITAIAASLSLRCYCLVQTLPLSSTTLAAPTLTLSLPDLGFTHEWAIDSLPWDLLSAPPSIKAPLEDSVPDATLLERISGMVAHTNVANATSAGVKTFLYLYMQMAGSIRLSQRFVVRSSLPIGAGLGSSAAFSVAVVSALLYSHSHIAHPSVDAATAKKDHASLVNAWAFMGEKIIHGTPSGVDNTVSSLGGAIAFRKTVAARQGGLESLQGFKSIRFLLTDTGVPRDTKTLVAGVARRKLEEPATINALLTAISRISSHAQITLTSKSLPRNLLISELEILMEENHGHLVALGVGHDALERIRERTKQSGLVSKLTGAGGGGCAVTIIPDEFSAESLDALRADLAASGCTTYETTVGGPGFNLFSLPSLPSSPGSVSQRADELERSMRAPTTCGLEEWASGVGQWQFV